MSLLSFTQTGFLPLCVLAMIIPLRCLQETKTDLVYIVTSIKDFLVAQLVKNLPALQETWAPSLGLEDPLKKGKVTYSSSVAWRIP